MSLDKAIEHGKEHRKPYRGAKAIDKTCRNHGDDPWTQRARQYKIKKREKLEEYEDGQQDEIFDDFTHECEPPGAG